MDLSSFLTSLGTSFAVFVILMFLFAWLSTKPGNAVVYYPNRILKGLEPCEGGSKTRNPFAWIKEALTSTEQEVIAISGVDTAVYFVFLSTVLGILVLSSLILLPMLLPVSATDTGDTATNTTTSNGTFSDLDKLSIGNVEVNKLWKELEGFRKKLERAEAVYAASKTTGSPEGTRPTNKTGFLGLCGAKVDSIEYYTKKINETIPKLEAEQKATLREKQLNAAIVFFTSRAAAASAAQSLHAQMVDKWTVTDASEPRQVLWPNLKIKFFQRQVRQYVVYIIVALTVVFYMIPIAFISAFTTLDNLVKLIPFIKPVVNQSALKTVLEAFLPQLALIIFLALLPKLLFALSKAEGIPSQSHAVRAASGKYFYFTVFNVFLGVTIGGTLFSTFKEIEKEPNKIISLLATSLPGNATYFVTFVALKFFMGYGLELSRLVPLIIFHLKRKYLCKTEGELKAAWQPSDLGYGTRVPGDLLIVTIVLCYSVIAPLIIPFGVLYFGIGWLVLRNQALKVYCPAYESYGRFWPHMQIRILAALILYQVTMLGFFGVKKFIYAPFVIPLPILSLIFCYVCSKKFYRFFKDAALEVASHELKDIPNMEQIYKSYLPPSLISEKGLLDDDQFEDAKSNVSRTTSFA
ncbi:hypothetical protein ABKV19_006156 [Rosa sericea]